MQEPVEALVGMIRLTIREIERSLGQFDGGLEKTAPKLLDRDKIR